MKIILIQQAQTAFRWAAAYDAAGYARALETERVSSILRAERKKSGAGDYRVYTGTERASRETAELLFTLSAPPVETPLLDEAALRPSWTPTKPCPCGCGAPWAGPSGRREAAARRKAGERPWAG